MSKKIFSQKTPEERLRRAISELPTRDNQSVLDAQVYLSLSDDALSKLPAFENGEVKFYSIGDVLMGKSTLIQFVKQLKK